MEMSELADGSEVQDGVRDPVSGGRDRGASCQGEADGRNPRCGDSVGSGTGLDETS